MKLPRFLAARFCGGLIRDMKRRYSLYWSDIKDGIHLQCLSSVVFLYFAVITPIVTFGGLLGIETKNYMVSGRARDWHLNTIIGTTIHAWLVVGLGIETHIPL